MQAGIPGPGSRGNAIGKRLREEEAALGWKTMRNHGALKPPTPFGRCLGLAPGGELQARWLPHGEGNVCSWNKFMAQHGCPMKSSSSPEKP